MKKTECVQRGGGIRECMKTSEDCQVTLALDEFGRCDCSLGLARSLLPVQERQSGHANSDPGAEGLLTLFTIES